MLQQTMTGVVNPAAKKTSYTIFVPLIVDLSIVAIESFYFSLFYSMV